MVIHELTEAECREMLARTKVAHLACARNNQPYVLPIRVDLDGQFLYGYATLGQKVDWMRQNPLVCVEFDELIAHGNWASVVVFGKYEELPHTPGYEGSRKTAERLFQRHPSWWEPASVPVVAQPQRPPIVFRIRIARMTGRRTTRDAGKTVNVRADAPETRRPRWLAQVLRRVVARH